MKKRKIAVIQPASGPQSNINVTPLVDVVLVLLIIFMVVMPLLEKNFAVNIPKNEQVAEPSDVPPDQVIVNVDGAGEFRINGDMVPKENYVAALQTRLGTRALSDRIVFVSSDQETEYTRLIQAYEGARKAGAETLAMITPDPNAPADAPLPGAVPSGAEPAATSGTLPAPPAPPAPPPPPAAP